MSTFAALAMRVTSIMNRLRFWVRRTELDKELVEEMRYHEELLVRDGLAKGLSPSEARMAARRRFGNATYFREGCRESWGFRWLDEAGQDLRFGWRSIGRNRVLSGALVLTLALAIGANTAIFSLINLVLLRPLPVEDPTRFVQVTRIQEDGRPSASFPPVLIERLGQGARTISGLAAFDHTRLNIVIDGQAEPALGRLVSGNFFTVAGVSAGAGRLIGPDDDVPSASPVAVISHGFWSRRFGRSPSAIGQVVDLNGAPMTVIGVLPPDFTLSPGLGPEDVWAPLALHAQLGLNDHTEVLSYARIGPGATRETASAELTAVYRGLVDDSLTRTRSRISGAAPETSGAGTAGKSGKFARSASTGASLIELSARDPERIYCRRSRSS